MREHGLAQTLKHVLVVQTIPRKLRDFSSLGILSGVRIIRVRQL